MDDPHYPLTLAAAVELQEQLAGRPLSEREREIVEDLLPTINHTFEAGTRLDSRYMHGLLSGIDLWSSKADQRISDEATRGFVGRFCHGFRCWIIHAWKQGLLRRARRAARGRDIKGASV